ncbi:MAG: hypothetical protein JWN23_2732 [Rhodocyclales bacterium]|nr:hypothetical protein [Rhodocyclales bacterium]
MRKSVPKTRQHNDVAMTDSYAVGDVVFIRASSMLFNQVSGATGCWTNHVGVIVGHDYVVAESRVPLSSTTRLRRFVARSQDGRYAVRPWCERYRTMSSVRSAKPP